MFAARHNFPPNGRGATKRRNGASSLVINESTLTPVRFRRTKLWPNRQRCFRGHACGEFRHSLRRRVTSERPCASIGVAG